MSRLERFRLGELVDSEASSWVDSKVKLGRLVEAAQVLANRGVALDQPVGALFVPGRIEVLGKHTDYAGGRSLTCATEQGFWMVVAQRSDSVLRVGSKEKEAVELELRADLDPYPGSWADYPRAVAQRFAADWPRARRGADIAFGSDLSPAAGISSSSALVTAVFLALAEANSLEKDPEFCRAIPDRLALASYLGAVENGRRWTGLADDGGQSTRRGVGTLGGSEDHVAILCSQPGRLRSYRYSPVLFEASVPLPANLIFVVASSGVVAEKAGAVRERYNRLSRVTSEAAAYWRQRRHRTGGDAPDLGAIAVLDPEAAGWLPAAFAAQRRKLPEAGKVEEGWVRNRLEAFFEENESIVPSAIAALEAGDLSLFASLVDASQKLAEDKLQNQVEETRWLAASARKLGAVAASAFGGGFGGSVWALVEIAESSAFLDHWRSAYFEAFPRMESTASFFTTRASNPALWLGSESPTGGAAAPL